MTKAEFLKLIEAERMEILKANPAESPEQVEAKAYFRANYKRKQAENAEPREITSMTYKRAQKRLEKQVQAFCGFR